MLKLVFMGSDPIALPALDWLATSELTRVVAVFTQPDRAAGRGQQVKSNSIKLWALARNIPVFQPVKFGPAEQQQLATLNPDLTLVMAYGHILKQDVITTPRLGTLNLHTSILPHYRGASPIQTAIASAESETGVTLMRIVPRLDAGPVADVERVTIDPLDTATEVETKLAAACVPLLEGCLPRIAAGTQGFTAQDESQATYCRRLEKADGALDFSAPARVLAGRINGLMPWPGCTVEINGQTIRLGRAEALPGENPPGETIGADGEGMLVGTGRGILRLRELQRPGGKMLPAAGFLRGFPIRSGVKLSSRPMPALLRT